jgi:hypothetical protein
MTRAQAKKRMLVFEKDWLVPLVEELDLPTDRQGTARLAEHRVRDALYYVHEYLRRTAIEAEKPASD